MRDKDSTRAAAAAAALGGETAAARPGARKPGLSRRGRDLIFCLLVLAPPLAQFAIFYVGVNFNSFLLAFKKYTVTETGASLVEWIGFANFRQFFSSLFGYMGALKNALVNSLALYLVNLVVGVPLSLGFSYYIYKKLPGGKAFTVILFLPSMISSIVMVILYSYFVDRAIPGMLAKWFSLTVEGPLASGYRSQFWAVVFFYVWSNFGLGILMYSSAMSKISPDVLEAAVIDGITPLKEFFRITLPLIYPTITAFMVIGMAGLFTNQANLFSFFQENAASQIQTMGYYLFKTVMASESYTQYPLAAAGGLTLTLFAVPLTLGLKFLLERFGPQPE